MNNVQLTNQEAATISSTEVATMVGRNHADVLRDLRNIKEQLGQLKIAESDYFSESTYINAQNKSQPCFSLTKKGCELYATRMTGSKGTAFAVAYIERFNQMELELTRQLTPSYQIADPVERAKKWIEEQQQKQRIEETAKTAINKLEVIAGSDTLLTTTVIAKEYGMSATRFNSLLHELRFQYKVGKQWVPYAEFASEGYVKTVTHLFETGSSSKTTHATKWTEKGRQFLYDFLAENEIYPVCENESLFRDDYTLLIPTVQL